MVASERGTITRTYGNWRKPVSAGLGQLGMLGTGILFGGLIVVIITAMLAGVVAAVVVGAVLAVFLTALVVKDRHGRSGLQRITGLVLWRRARGSGSNLYRSGPLGRTAWGTYQLPGLLAPARLMQWQDSYGRPFALLHLPATNHFTVVIATEPDGASLVDPDQIDFWVASWGNWLNSLGSEPGVIAASVTVESAPDSGARLRREVAMNADPDAPELAQQMLREVVDRYPQGSATVRAWIALTLTGTNRATGKKKTAEQMGQDLASRLPGLTQALHATGAGAARPVDAQELCEIVRIAYDPPAARLIEAAHASGEVPQLHWYDVGPSFAEAHRDHYLHEGSVSVTWTMSGAPRGIVHSSVLASLLGQHREVDRKRVTLIYRVIDPARSARLAEQDKLKAQFVVNSAPRPSARAVADLRFATVTADEEARGHNLINFGMVVTATVAEVERLPDVIAAIDNLSATARVQLRPAYGSQDSAFAAGLPLGLVLSAHSKVPVEIRESL